MAMAVTLAGRSPGAATAVRSSSRLPACERISTLGFTPVWRQGVGATRRANGRLVTLSSPSPSPDAVRGSSGGGDGGDRAEQKAEGGEPAGGEATATPQTEAGQPAGNAAGDGSGADQLGSQQDIGNAIRALRDARASEGVQEPSTNFWSGVVEETRLIEWPSFQKVLGTTSVVVAMILGSGVVLLTVNAILSQLSDNVFKNL